MAQLKNFKTITRHVMIEGHDYVLVRFNIVNMTNEERGFEWLSDTMYGTIDRNDIDENNKTKRVLSLGDLWAAETIPEALERRQNFFDCLRTIEELKRDHPEVFNPVKAKKKGGK